MRREITTIRLGIVITLNFLNQIICMDLSRGFRKTILSYIVHP